MRFTSRAKIAARALLHRAGVDLVRSLDPSDLLRRRLQLIERYGVNVIFDVGANAGQYGTTMRALGYTGRLVSFEPSTEAFELLARTARRDPLWTVVNVGLGETEATVALNVSGNSQSSSLLGILPTHLSADPESAYVHTEAVRITTLAAAIEEHVSEGDRLFVKVDTQGSERQVLAGAGPRLAQVVGLQVELSLVPLYEGQALMEELIADLRTLGFVPMSIEPDFFHPETGQLLQADGVFFRSDPPPAGPLDVGPVAPPPDS